MSTIRLSFLAPVDQSRYESLFQQASKNTTTMSAMDARNVLSRSNLGDDALAKIWDLSNVTQSPFLTFPEFAVAMYLTSMKMTGREIPDTLPDAIRQEIETAVAMIRSTESTSTVSAPAPGMGIGTGTVPTMQQPALIRMPAGQTALVHHNVGSAPTIQHSLPTGIPVGQQGPMLTHNGFQPQMTGVSLPQGMQGHNLDFTNRMMPSASGIYSTPQQQFKSSSKINIPWAVTKEEKERYSKIFKAWDKDHRGYLTGDVAKEIFQQSGLPQNILMQIWNLSDLNNQGKLNMDEFAVSMHLVYRKINGFDVPTILPAELIPPSTRDLNDSVSELKKSILEGIAQKRGIANFSSSPSLLSPHQNTPRARSLSPHPVRSNSNSTTATATETVGYVSSARRMGPDRGRSRDRSPDPSASRSVTSSYEYRGKTTRIMDLRKEMAEQKKRIQEWEKEGVQVKPKSLAELSFMEKKEIESLKERVKELQTEIIKSGGDSADHLWDEYIERTAELSSIADHEKALEREARHFLEDGVLDMVRQVKETEDDLADKKIRLVKAKAAKSSQEAPVLDIVGTGPGGVITESDRIRAKAKAMVAARMGKITGKSTAPNVAAEIKKIEDECVELKAYADLVAESLQEIQGTLESVHIEMSMIGLDIGKQSQDQKKIEERNRFERGHGVGEDLKAFIQLLSYETATLKAPDVDPTFESRFPEF
ncbi:hypothetical protein BDF14DRAFT_1882331 [Spinellus fusiger]|nr:hypothetical protein BDF14DRAFT_1882331 [Spinellus fusiger]